MTGYLSTTETRIDASPHRVWEALTDPDQIASYMFGSRVRTDWRPGSPITWRGEYDGRSYEDKGEIVAVTTDERLELTHFSPLSGAPDVPESYHSLVYALEPDGTGTRLTLTQDNNASEEEADRATDTWAQVLAGIKEVAEG